LRYYHIYYILFTSLGIATLRMNLVTLHCMMYSVLGCDSCLLSTISVV